MRRHRTPSGVRKQPRNVAFYDDEDRRCPTCSEDSSSEDSDDDPYAYQVAPRKAYGGVRLTYVPNDRRRRAKLMSDPRKEYVPRNVNGMNPNQGVVSRTRSGSVQPTTQQQQHHSTAIQQQHQHQQPSPMNALRPLEAPHDGGFMLGPQQPISSGSSNSSSNLHQQQVPYYPSHPGHHRNPAANGMGPDSKDKNCIIS